MEWICAELPAAQQLANDVVVQLLLAAVEGGVDAAGLSILCRLPTAQSRNCSEVLELLQAAVKAGSVAGGSRECLCRLPAAQQLSSSVVAQLLQAAAENGNKSMTRLGQAASSKVAQQLTVPACRS
jgi:hypothetical protein